MKPVVTICAATGQSVARAIQQCRPDIPVKCVDSEKALHSWSTDSSVVGDLLDAEILCTDGPLFDQVSAELTNLRWLHCLWAGVEPLVKLTDQLKHMDLTVTRQGATYARGMADYVVGQIIARERNFHVHKEFQSQRQWSRESASGSNLTHFRLLSELSIGILGLGDIGTLVARHCKALGMTVWGMVRSSSPPAEICDRVVSQAGLDELLGSVEYVCNVLPSTDATRKLLTADRFKACRNKKACFINIGRGDVTTEDDLLQALNKGWLSAAILDVFETEPLPVSSRLWTRPEVVVTPHVSGTAKPEQLADVIVRNYDLYCTSKQLEYTVNFDTQY